MPEVSIEVEVYCSCGEGLCGQSTGGSGHRGEPIITVEPCEKCKQIAHDEGYDEGLEKNR